MTKIDELLEMNGIVKKIDKNETLMQEYLKKFAKTLYPGDKGTRFNTSMYDVDIFDSFMEMENIDMINPADIEQYKKCATEYAQLNERLENFQEGKHLSLFDFYEYKTQFLNQLVSTQHIRDVGEEPKEFFKKLIELYGEDELADFGYREYYDYIDDFETKEYIEDYDIDTNSRLFTISDFVFGEEDKVIELISDEDLRKELLASKLEYLYKNGVDIAKYIQEYVDAAAKHDISNLVYLDEYEEVDLEATLSDFASLPISQDRNFYLYLVKHLDEMGVNFETLLDYIDPNMIDEEFGTALAQVNNTKQYEYKEMNQDEYYRILEEADEEYLRIIDLEIDSKIEEYIAAGYAPEDILSKLEFEDGVHLSPESIKDLYYKCGHDYNIENRVKEEHTAEEIGEGIGDLTQSEVGEALNAVTDIGETQKDPHNLE